MKMGTCGGRWGRVGKMGTCGGRGEVVMIRVQRRERSGARGHDISVTG